MKIDKLSIIIGIVLACKCEKNILANEQICQLIFYFINLVFVNKGVTNFKAFLKKKIFEDLIYINEENLKYDNSNNYS